MEELQDLVNVSDYGTIWRNLVEKSKVFSCFKKLDERAVIPQYAHDGDVGMDLTAIDVEYDREKDCYIYHTGLSFETDKHYGIFLFPRSSNRKTDAYLCNHVGIVDSATYRGEVILCFKNRISLEERANMARNDSFFNSIAYNPFVVSSNSSIEFPWISAVQQANAIYSNVYESPFAYAPYQIGDRVAQMVILPYPTVELTQRDELTDTERGDGGFGSTGN